MATLKSSTASPFFYIFDFYLMNDSSDSNDIVPIAILYFYPTDEESKKQVTYLITLRRCRKKKLEFMPLEIIRV